MNRLIALALLLVGTQCFLAAVPVAPEIDPGSAASAVALLAGAVLVIRGRRR